MIDKNSLLTQLRINGISQATSLEEIDKILTALRYTPEQRQEAFIYLKTLGWGLRSSTPVPVTHLQETQNKINMASPLNPDASLPLPKSKIYYSNTKAVTEEKPPSPKKKGGKPLPFILSFLVLLIIALGVHLYITNQIPIRISDYFPSFNKSPVDTSSKITVVEKNNTINEAEGTTSEEKDNVVVTATTSSVCLTVNDVAKVSYPIYVNDNGKAGSLHNITFKGEGKSFRVQIARVGEGNGSKEYFWINSYRFVDSCKLKVFILGDMGDYFDIETFNVSKVNNKLVAEAGPFY